MVMFPIEKNAISGGHGVIENDYVSSKQKMVKTKTTTSFGPLLSKWNRKFVKDQAVHKNTKKVLNRGLSYLVAPHNLTFDKKSIKVYETNKTKVIGDCDKIIKKYDDMIEHKLKGMSSENNDKSE